MKVNKTYNISLYNINENDKINFKKIKKIKEDNDKINKRQKHNKKKKVKTDKIKKDNNNTEYNIKNIEENDDYKTLDVLDNQTKDVTCISYHIKNIMNILKLPKSDILNDTPLRFAKCLLYLTKGYNEDVTNIVKNSIYERNYQNNSIIKIKNLKIYSLCKHHLLPFEGFCTIEYKPNKYILGLSKFSRIINIYSRRLQLQEDLTNEICEILKNYLKPLNIQVTIIAKHMCINMRGVKQHNTETETNVYYEMKDNKYIKYETIKNDTNKQ